MLTMLMWVARLYLWNWLPGGKRARGYSINVMRARHPSWLRDDLERLFGMLATGAILPRIAERISLDGVAEAHRRFESGGLQGKLVLCPDLLSRRDHIVLTRRPDLRFVGDRGSYLRGSEKARKKRKTGDASLRPSAATAPGRRRRPAGAGRAPGERLRRIGVLLISQANFRNSKTDWAGSSHLPQARAHDGRRCHRGQRAWQRLGVHAPFARGGNAVADLSSHLRLCSGAGIV